MALQPIFKRGYIEYLKTHVEPSLYMGDSLDYDQAALHARPAAAPLAARAQAHRRVHRL